MIITSITQHIGNTPLLLIPESIHKVKGCKIYAKLEYLNPFWSIKDRTALWILSRSEEKDLIESSSGNTAKALWILANLSGKKFITVTNRIRHREIEDILRVIWVEIQNLPPWSECPDPNDPNSPFRTIQNILEKNPWKYHWTDQYTNNGNTKIHHDTTAKEIDHDMGSPDYFFAWLWTTGSSRGIIEYFEEKWANMKSFGIITDHWSYIPGIRNSNEMGEVWLFEKHYYKDFLPVSDQVAIEGMLKLVRKCGILVWPTSGAVFEAMIAYLQSLDPIQVMGKKVVFIACDRIEPYTWYLRAKHPSLFETQENPAKQIELWETLTISESQLRDEKYLLVDMRSRPSYEIWHIPRSLSFPYHKLESYVKEGYLPFPKEMPIVFICPFWEESALMSQMANGLGYTTYSLEKWVIGMMKNQHAS